MGVPTPKGKRQPIILAIFPWKLHDILNKENLVNAYFIITSNAIGTGLVNLQIGPLCLTQCFVYYRLQNKV